MYAVVVRVTINDVEAAETRLHEVTVPRVSQLPEAVAGYWTRRDNTGVSMVIFGTEDAARQASEQVPSMVTDAVSLQDVEVREVIAHF